MLNVPSRIKMNKEGYHHKQIDISLPQSYSVNLVPKMGVLGDMDVQRLRLSSDSFARPQSSVRKESSPNAMLECRNRPPIAPPEIFKKHR